MKNFISPDGHAVRFIISHEDDPLGTDGIERIDAIKNAAFGAIKGTPLEGSRVYLGGTASTFKDMRDGNAYDLLIAGIAALTLIFIVMLIITRSVVAAGVIVGTVVLSLGASFGLSVLFWQHLIGLDLEFMVMAMAVIILLAVGADYNLLLVAPIKEEIPAGASSSCDCAVATSVSCSCARACCCSASRYCWVTAVRSCCSEPVMSASTASWFARWRLRRREGGHVVVDVGVQADLRVELVGLCAERGAGEELLAPLAVLRR